MHKLEESKPEICFTAIRHMQQNMIDNLRLILTKIRSNCCSQYVHPSNANGTSPHHNLQLTPLNYLIYPINYFNSHSPAELFPVSDSYTVLCMFYPLLWICNNHQHCQHIHLLAQSIQI